MSILKVDNENKKIFVKKQSEKLRYFVHFVPTYETFRSDQ